MALIFVFHNSHHARSSNPSVINCCCVLVRKVATLHVTTPTIIVHDPTRVQRSLGWQDKKLSVVRSGRGLPTHTGSPTILGAPAGGFLLTHTPQQALGHGCPVKHTPLPEDDLQGYCYQSPTQRSSFSFFLLTAHSLCHGCIYMSVFWHPIGQYLGSQHRRCHTRQKNTKKTQTCWISRRGVVECYKTKAGATMISPLNNCLVINQKFLNNYYKASQKCLIG